MTKNQELIIKIETKIQAMKDMLKSYKVELVRYENILFSLIQQVNELKIKEIINQNKK